MKSLILLLSLIGFNAYAQVPTEPVWKTSLRGLVAKFSPVLSESLFGAPPMVSTMSMPEIPKDLKKTTDTSTYNRKEKDPTEFDRLPTERKRQFDYKFLEELFLVTRKTDAKDEDIANWLNTLDQGGSREGIYQALVLDDVYATLENMEERPSDRLVQFVQNFSQRYLALAYSEDALTQNNLFTLKRIMTEKGLDLLEYYETHDLDSLYRWYALLSGNLGKDYAPLLQNEIRKDASPEFHYEWAKNMPIQHIKSEFIIKLHSVMNGLQLLQ